MEKYYLGKTITINSIFHFIFPFIIGYIFGKKWYYGILILICFELFENLLGLTIIILNWEIFSPEPFINIVSDLVIGTLGLYSGNRLKLFKSK
jgi:hypothetical protein